MPLPIGVDDEDDNEDVALLHPGSRRPLTNLRQLDFIDKCIKNCKEQPLVPLGTLATTVAVILAAKSLRVGNRPGAQKWFRYRVGFQGFTIAALVIGGIVYGRETQDTRKSKEEELREKAKLRERLWIEELEKRDHAAKERKKRAEIARQKYAEQLEAEKNAAESDILKQVKDIEEQKK